MNNAIIRMVICFCLILAACGQEEPPSAPPEIQSTGTIVAMGDSLSEGLGVPEENTYPALLQ